MEPLPADEQLKTGSPKQRGYYIYVTEACNLRCNYCFVKNKVNQRHLTEEVAQRILAFIKGEGSDLKKVYVHFFGGEPLIRPAMVDYLATELRSWAGEKGVELRLGITTNGTLLSTANCEMLKRHGVGVQLSLDGGKQGNDVHRQLMGGTQSGLAPAGAFDLVQIQNYIAYFGRQRPNCRMTVTVHNLSYLSESIRELHALGFKSFSVIPEADCGVWTPEHLSRYEAEMDRVFGYWAAHRDITVNSIQQTIDKLAQMKERRYLCPVGQTIVGFTVDGDIYPCHDFAGRFAGDPVESARLILGNAGSGYLPERRSLWPLVRLDGVKSGNGYDCGTCWARWSCGRGCPYMNFAHSGDIRTVSATYCATSRVNASLALRWMSALGELRPSDSKRSLSAERGAGGPALDGKNFEAKAPRRPLSGRPPETTRPASGNCVLGDPV